MRVNPREAERLSVVMFIYHSMIRNGCKKPTENDVMEKVMQWKNLKCSESDKEELALTVRNLAALGWINPHASHDLPLPDEIP